MTALPVEWVLVIYYGLSAHRATYGRLRGTKYTKDYIQLSKRMDFLADLFPTSTKDAGSVPLLYKWPAGSAPGELVFLSADRPHLKWETVRGAPLVWKMSLTPSEMANQTIPGNPTFLDDVAADKEFKALASRGVGQPYLMAVKLRDESNTLHLRAYLEKPSPEYAWADLRLVPQDIQDLAATTSQQSALAWSRFQSGGAPLNPRINSVLAELMASEDLENLIYSLDIETGQAIVTCLQCPAHGLFFDPTRNHDAWLQPIQLANQTMPSIGDLLTLLEARFPVSQHGDAVAETLGVSFEEVDAFRKQIEQKNYEVLDSLATVKTRGSAQKAFAEAVKTNYDLRCAITGIETKDFLVASHIVPWSEDQSIRLDPSNGICLSLLVDRAFEKGYLLIEDDLTIRIDVSKIGDDQELKNQLKLYHQRKLSMPKEGAPRKEYLQRRRILVNKEK